MKWTILMLVAAALLAGCLSDAETKQEKTMTQIPSAEADLSYRQTIDLIRQAGYNIVELRKGDTRVAISPDLAGRVVATTVSGPDGFNPLFLNPVDVLGGPAADKLVFRGAIGARDWLGPEGCGDMSFYFHEKPLVFENWYVNDDHNLPRLKVAGSATQRQVTTVGEIHVSNLRGNKFDIELRQQVQLLSDPTGLLGLALNEPVDAVGFERQTSFKNIGNHAWNEDYGHAMIWYLLMLRATDNMYIMAPFQDGPGPEVVDYNFNDGQPIPPDRLIVRPGKQYIIFRADARLRGKIGMSPARSRGVACALDLDRNMVTVLRFDVDRNAEYLNNLWTEEPQTTGGNCMDAYSNTRTNEALPGPFCEIEAVSPRLELAPGETGTLRTVSVFIKADADTLKDIVRQACSCDVAGETFRP